MAAASIDTGKLVERGRQDLILCLVCEPTRPFEFILKSRGNDVYKEEHALGPRLAPGYIHGLSPVSPFHDVKDRNMLRQFPVGAFRVRICRRELCTRKARGERFLDLLCKILL